VALWDLFGNHGLPIRNSVQEMGSDLPRMLRLPLMTHGQNFYLRPTDLAKNLFIALSRNLVWIALFGMSNEGDQP
jgi:hypothetical protein